MIDLSSNDTLRMRTDEGGHMPLLFKVKKIRCSTSKDSFTILITEKDLPEKKEVNPADEKEKKS